MKINHILVAGSAAVIAAIGTIKVGEAINAHRQKRLSEEPFWLDEMSKEELDKVIKDTDFINAIPRLKKDYRYDKECVWEFFVDKGFALFRKECWQYQYLLDMVKVGI